MGTRIERDRRDEANEQVKFQYLPREARLVPWRSGTQVRVQPLTDVLEETAAAVRQRDRRTITTVLRIATTQTKARDRYERLSFQAKTFSACVVAMIPVGYESGDWPVTIFGMILFGLMGVPSAYELLRGRKIARLYAAERRQIWESAADAVETAVRRGHLPAHLYRDDMKALEELARRVKRAKDPVCKVLGR